MEKARELNEWLLGFWTRDSEEVDLRLIDVLLTDSRFFKFNAGLDREPVELFKKLSSIGETICLCNNSSERILYTLQFINILFRYGVE